MTVFTIGTVAALICLILGLSVVRQEDRKQAQKVVIRQKRDKWGES